MAIFRGMYDTKKFTEFFMSQINEIMWLDSDSVIINILDKIDDILMASFRLITMKDQISRSIQGMSQGFKNLGNYKSLIMTHQRSIGELLEIVRLTEIKE